MPTVEEIKEADASLRAIRASGLCQIYHDALIVLSREVAALVDESARLTLECVAGDHPVSQAMNLGTSLIIHEKRIQTIIESQQQKLTEILAADLQERKSLGIGTSH